MKTESCGFTSDESQKLHEGHRARMRERFLRHGADSLETHELLEMLLFYCIRMRNTNETAHAMIKRFGSLEGVLSATAEELKQFDYITDSGAVLIKLVGEIGRRKMIESKRPVSRYDTLEKVGEFLVGLFYGLTEERMYFLAFDSAMRLLDCSCVGEGGPTSINMCSRKIIESTIYSKAENVIIAHNHPNGIAVPSRNDISMTHQLESVLRVLDTRLLCHIIVAGDKYAPINDTLGGKFDLTI